MKNKSIVLAAAVVAASVLSGNVYAGDCKKVSQKFINDLDVRIKVKKSVITGNDGKWTENFKNKKINAGNSWATDKRRFNKLDSGHKPSPLIVYFDRWNASDNKWVADSKTFSNLAKCYDNMQYQLRID